MAGACLLVYRVKPLPTAPPTLDVSRGNDCDQITRLHHRKHETEATMKQHLTRSHSMSLERRKSHLVALTRSLIVERLIMVGR